MKLSHLIVAVVFFVLGAAAALGYMYQEQLCFAGSPKVGLITEPRSATPAPMVAKAPSSAVSRAPKMSFRIEQAVNRHGSDYRDFEMAADDAFGVCQKACTDDTKCLAFTFVKAGVQGTGPHCWLKNSVPQAYPDASCVSGVKV